MNNTFFDTHYEIEFQIPFERQLTQNEAEIIARRIISDEKEAFYQAWKSRPQNKNWTGDTDIKKEEIFIARHRMKSPIMVHGLDIEAILKAALQTNN